MTPPMSKIRVGVLFGGKSVEHEVSLQSAQNILKALDPGKYEPILIAIDKEGRWALNRRASFLLQSDDPGRIRLAGGGRTVTVLPWQDPEQLVAVDDGSGSQAVDVVFPVLHGPLGEDGTVQGLLKLAGIPCVGSGVLASALAMDKDVCKRLLKAAGIPVAEWLVAHAHQPPPEAAMIADLLGLPCFVKPANLGSSVGITKVTLMSELTAALREAFRYDRKVLIEQAVTGREIECSVLGNDRPIASRLGEVVPAHSFYSYQAKYIDEQGARLEIPARLAEGVEEEVRRLAIEVFRTLGCRGMARVDFFVTPDDQIIVNEINTIPGFTRISMYPQLWEISGISYPELIDRLIQLALRDFQQQQKLEHSFSGEA